MGEVKTKTGPNKVSDNLSSYSDRAASDLGVDKRTVQRDLRRGKNIDADVLAEVSGPPSRVALFRCAGGHDTKQRWGKRWGAIPAFTATR